MSALGLRLALHGALLIPGLVTACYGGHGAGPGSDPSEGGRTVERAPGVATPMGASNLLDHTVIYGISEVSDPKSHSHSNYPVTIVGRAGGRLLGNLHHQAPGAKVTEVVFTLLNVMGVPIDSWGAWDNTNKVMGALLA